MARRNPFWALPRFAKAARADKHHRRLSVRRRLERLESRQLLACDAVPGAEMVFEEIYRENFEAGDGGFVVDNTGQNLPGLWHRTAGRRFDGLDNHSPLHSFYYGAFETAFGNGHYVLTDSHRGTITSPPITLPAGGTTLLNFSYLLDTRPELDRDFVSVSIIDDNDVIEILSRQDGTLPETPIQQWSTAAYDLSAFNGNAIQLQFLFDTGAIPRIDPEGWYVDDIVILHSGTADLSIDKTVDDSSPNVDQLVTYTLTASSSPAYHVSADCVTVMDLLPPGLTIVDVVPSAGSYDRNSGQWSDFALAPGETQTLTIRASVDPGTAAMILANTATIDAPQDDPDPSNNTDTETITVNSVDLAISKTADDATPNEGQTLSYTLTASNAASSNAAATNVLVQETLPAGVTFVSASSTDFDVSTQVWTIGELAVGASESLTIVVTVDAGVAGELLSNTVTIGGDETDPDLSNNTDTEVVTVNSVDLAISKTADDATPNEGQTLSYTLTASNAASSNAAATNVLVQETLPAGVTFVSASSPDFDISTQVWTVGELAAGASESLTIVVTVDAGVAGELLTNTVTIGGDETDPDPSNNTDTEVVTVNSVDLAISKTADDVTPNEGQTLSYTLTVSNAASSNAAATSVLVQETLPAGVTFVSASSTDFDVSTQVWTIGELAVGASESLTIVVTVDAGVAGELLSNTVTIGGDETDPDLSNNTDTEVVTVNSVDLAISKTADDATPNEGQTLSYTLTASNAASSNAAATNVLVQETLPAGVTFVSASSPDFDISTQVWTVGELAAGASESLTIVVTVDAGVAGELLTNTVTIDGNETDPDPSNNTDTEVLTVNSVDLAISKTADDATPNEGQTLSYTVTISNAASSNAAATNVLVQETLPAGVTFVSASSPDFDISTQVWTVGELAVGASESLTIVVTVDPGVAGELLSNTVTIGGDETDPDPSNDTDTEVVTVNSVDLAISKTADDDTPNEGQTLSYTLTVSNAASSNAAATNVLVQETLPAGVTFVSASNPDFDISTQVWTVGELAVGASESLTIVVTVDAGVAGELLTNTVTIGGDETDPDPSNNTDTENVTVNSVDLAISKTADDATPNEGQTLSYTLTASNAASSNAAATNVLVQETLPAGVTFVSASSPDFDINTQVWMVGELAAGASESLTIVVTVDAGTAGETLTNTVTVQGGETDPNPANNFAEEDVTVEPLQIETAVVQFINPLSVFRTAGPFTKPADSQLTVLGRIWDDANGNGQWDSGETGIAGVQVELVLPNGDSAEFTQSRNVDVDQNGVIDPVTETGLYWFSKFAQGDFTAGQHKIVLRLPAGVTPSFPAGSVEHTIELTSPDTQVTGDPLQAETPNFGLPQNFVEQPPAAKATISGYSWADIDQNGQWDATERGRGGWSYFIDINGNGLHDIAGSPNPDGTIVTETEPLSVTGEDGRFVFPDLDPGQYTILEVPSERAAGMFRVQTFPGLGGAQTVTVTAGQHLAGQRGVAETPNLGLFEYSPFIRPADEILGHAEKDAAVNQDLVRALTPWQSFEVTNASGAPFEITQFDKSGITSTTADYLSLRMIDGAGQMMEPPASIPVAAGASVRFILFYDPAARENGAVVSQSPEWLGPRTPTHSFSDTDRFVVSTNTGLEFPVRMVGGSTYDSDIFYDGAVNFGDLGRLTDLQSQQRVIIEGESARFDPSSDINARCPNGFQAVVDSCAWPLNGARPREIGFGDFGTLNVELLSARGPFLDLDADNRSGALGADYETEFTGGRVNIVDTVDASFANPAQLRLAGLRMEIRDPQAGDSLFEDAAATTGATSLEWTDSASLEEYLERLKAVQFATTASQARTVEIAIVATGDLTSPLGTRFSETNGNVAVARVRIEPAASPASAGSLDQFFAQLSEETL